MTRPPPNPTPDQSVPGPIDEVVACIRETKIAAEDRAFAKAEHYDAGWKGS